MSYCTLLHDIQHYIHTLTKIATANITLERNLQCKMSKNILEIATSNKDSKYPKMHKYLPLFANSRWFFGFKYQLLFDTTVGLIAIRHFWFFIKCDNLISKNKTQTRIKNNVGKNNITVAMIITIIDDIKENISSLTSITSGRSIPNAVCTS